MLHWPWRSPLQLYVKDPLLLQSSMFSGPWPLAPALAVLMHFQPFWYPCPRPCHPTLYTFALLSCRHSLYLFRGCNWSSLRDISTAVMGLAAAAVPPSCGKRACAADLAAALPILPTELQTGVSEACAGLSCCSAAGPLN